MGRNGKKETNFYDVRCPFLPQSLNVPAYCKGKDCPFDLWRTYRLPLELRIRSGKSVLSGCCISLGTDVLQLLNW